MDPNEETPLAAPPKGGFGKSLGRGKIAGLLALALGLGMLGALMATDHKTTDIVFTHKTPLWLCDEDSVRDPCIERFSTFTFWSSVKLKCRELCRYGDAGTLFSSAYYGKTEGSDFYCGYGDSEDEVARLCCDLWGDAAKQHDDSNVFHDEDPCHPRED